MRIEFEALDGTGVRIIPLIEDHEISRIEGRNGAGKPMAIRLLQLCTGDHAYTREETSSWRELRRRLGRVRITCTALRDAETVEWLVDPSLWPENPNDDFAIVAEADGRPAVCAEARIDRAPATPTSSGRGRLTRRSDAHGRRPPSVDATRIAGNRVTRDC